MLISRGLQAENNAKPDRYNGRILLLLPAMATALEKRVQRLEGSRGPISTSGLGVWAADWADFDLISDASSVLQWCSFDQFVIGRACWAAWRYHGRMLDNYRYWKGHKEPDWYSNAAYLSKPGSKEWIAKERATYPPDSALVIRGLFYMVLSE